MPRDSLLAFITKLGHSLIAPARGPARPPGQNDLQLAYLGAVAASLPLVTGLLYASASPYLPAAVTHAAERQFHHVTQQAVFDLGMAIALTLVAYQLVKFAYQMRCQAPATCAGCGAVLFLLGLAINPEGIFAHSQAWASLPLIFKTWALAPLLVLLCRPVAGE